MTVAGLLHHLTRRRVNLRRHGDSIAVDAPLGVLSDDDRNAIRARKQELLTLLAELDSLERDGTADRWRSIATPECIARLEAEASGGDDLATVCLIALEARHVHRELVRRYATPRHGSLRSPAVK